MIIYEVNIEVHSAVFDDYRIWLDAHVKELLALPGFVEAEIFECCEPSSTSGIRSLCIQYRLRTQTDLERYLREHAPRLREAALHRFAGKFHATRRVMNLLSAFDST